MKSKKEKAKELVDKHSNHTVGWNYIETAKKHAIITVENEYHSLREMLFSLRSSYVIESEKVYLSRLDKLIELEKEIKNEIKKL